ncbi:MAG: LptA/OstA family protein [bacterium]
MRLKISTAPNLFNRSGVLALAVVFCLSVGVVRAWAGQGPTAPKITGSPSQPASGSEALDVKNQKKISSHKPVNITSNQLSFDKLDGLTLFNGAVKVVHGHVILNSDEVKASADNGVATALGHVKVDDLKANLHLTCGNLDYHDLMNLITAHDHPSLNTLDEKGEPLTIRSRQMELFPEEKKVVAHQDVEILHDGGRMEAQLATFDAQTDELVLEENPRVFLTQGTIAGRRITTHLTGDQDFEVDGMAEAEFYSHPRPIPKKPQGKGTSTPLNFNSPAPPTAKPMNAGPHPAIP